MVVCKVNSFRLVHMLHPNMYVPDFWALLRGQKYLIKKEITEKKGVTKAEILTYLAL